MGLQIHLKQKIYENVSTVAFLFKNLPQQLMIKL